MHLIAVLFALTLVSFCNALMPAALTWVNLREYREPPLLAFDAGAEQDRPSVSVVVPARNEEAGIAACIESVLQSRGALLEVLVLDDGSIDATAAIVNSIGAGDARVRLISSAALPAGWNGKQHACWQAAQAARSPVLCFLDADVRLEPDALARMAALLKDGDGLDGLTMNAGTRDANLPAGAAWGGRHAIALVSGFPEEQTGTALEWLLLPLIHFVLLGLLPMRLLRTTPSPGLAAGCGQFLMVDREAYFATGGHAAIRATMHDGLLLPRLFRQHDYPTRLADLTSLARCRMYRSAATTWNGLAKNATEGLGTPRAIVPMTLLLGTGQVLPLPLLLIAVARSLRHRSDTGRACGWDAACLALAGGAVALSYLPRVLEVRRFRQKKRSAALHPIGVATLLALQWYALGRKVLGKPATWKARTYAAN